MREAADIFFFSGFEGLLNKTQFFVEFVSVFNGKSGISVKYTGTLHCRVNRVHQYIYKDFGLLSVAHLGTMNYCCCGEDVYA